MHSVLLLFEALSFTYHANASTAIDIPIKKGRAGSILEKFEVMLLLPATKAITGVIQQSEAAIADSTPALVIAPDDFMLFILFAIFVFVG